VILPVFALTQLGAMALHMGVLARFAFLLASHCLPIDFPLA
jgi:hypothetical protein